MSNEERKQIAEERRNQVVARFLQTGESTRELAAYFTEHYFPITSTTVYRYLHRYMEDNLDSSEEIKEKIINNTELDYQNLGIQKQVLREANLLLDGYTIEEIANLVGKSYSSVNRDLTNRLQKICATGADYLEVFNTVQKHLCENQTSTIIENRKKQ